MKKRVPSIAFVSPSCKLMPAVIIPGSDYDCAGVGAHAARVAPTVAGPIGRFARSEARPARLTGIPAHGSPKRQVCPFCVSPCFLRESRSRSATADPQR